MDKLDIAIVRESTQIGSILPSRPGFAPSYREISKKLHTPLGTVRNRINMMYKSGVLSGSILFPNPNLVKLKAAAYTVEIPDARKKAKVFQEMKRFEGVVGAHDFVGSRAWIVFLYEDEAELARKYRLLRKISGPNGVLSNLPYPPCPDSFTKSDADLILRLSKNGLESYAKLARDLGLSERTLKRRILRLARDNMILSLPRLDYGAMAGCVPADLVVFFKDEKARAEGVSKVIELVMDYLLLAVLVDITGMCSLVLPKVASTSELAEKVKQINGVRDAWVEIVREHITEGKVFVEYFEKRMMN
jgi:DNA-binding Lrp family transcriptional regulator